jgi:hypothetical protein
LFRILTKLVAATSGPAVLSLMTYSQQILQSTHQSKSFISLLTQLYQNKLIDLQTLVNLLTSGKSDDSRHRAILSILVAAEDSQTVDGIVSTMCEKNDASFVTKLQQSVWDEKSGVATLVRRFPHPTLFRFLLDRLVSVRKTAVTLGKYLFKEAMSRTQFPIQMTPAERGRMLDLCEAMIDHMNNLIVTDNTFEPGYLAAERGRYFCYLKYFKWLVRCLGLLEGRIVEAVKQFYEKLKQSTHHKSDVLKCVSIMKLFPSSLYQASVVEYFQNVMADSSKTDDVCRFFGKFVEVLPYMELNELQEIVRHKSFPLLGQQFSAQHRKLGGFEKLVNSLQRFPDDAIATKALFDLFQAGYSSATFTTRPMYLKLLEVSCDRIPSSLLEGISAFILSVFSERMSCSHDVVTYRYAYCFEMCQIIDAAGLQLPNFEPDMEAILTQIRASFDTQLERPIGVFFLNMCKKHPPEYQESVRTLALDSFRMTTNYYPRTLLLSLIVKLIVLSDFQDADKVARLLAVYPEFVQFQGEVMSWKFFEELVKLSGTGANCPEWAPMFLNEAIAREEFVRSFSDQQRQGRDFLERVAGCFGREQALELFRKLVATKTPTASSEWVLVSWIFTRFRDFRAEFLDILPVKQRVASSDWEIEAAMEVIFEDRQLGPEVPEYDDPWDDGTGNDYARDTDDTAASGASAQP